MKRILAWFLALIMVFAMGSLPRMTKAEGEEDPDQPESVEEIVNDVEGKPETPGTKDGPYDNQGVFTLAVGETKQLDTSPTEGYYEVNWDSGDSTVVTVDQNGTVIACGVGYAIITAYCFDEFGYDSYFPLWEFYVTQLTLSTDALELPLGGSGALTASYTSVDETALYQGVSEDVTADCTWSWTGNDPAIASFDETTGTVTASDAQYGTATLTASYTPEGWDHAVLASCTVTVKAKTNDHSPTITAQPEDVKVKSGSKAKFSVKAPAKDLSYQWFKRIGPADDWFEMAGETKATLTFTATMLDDSSQYYCRVSNSDGETDSEVASLEVIPQVPVIKTQPRSAKVKSGAKVRLSMKASGKNLLYRWFSRPNANSEFVEMEGETKADLNLVASLALDGRQYCCEVRNTDGAEMSDIATLTVTPVPASIRTQPKDAAVKSGAKAKFKVSASGPNLQYQWFTRPTETDEWTEIDGAMKAEYSFTARLSQDGSQFYCKVWNDDETLTSGIATLTVTPQPIVIRTQPKDVSVKSGEKAKFSIKATGPKLSYQWFVRTSEDADWALINGAIKDHYSVKASDANNGWQFYCCVYNMDEEVSSNVVTLTLK